MEGITREGSQLAGRRFAIIVDEAHSSQSGKATDSIKTMLNTEVSVKFEEGDSEAGVKLDGPGISTEKVLIAFDHRSPGCTRCDYTTSICLYSSFAWSWSNYHNIKTGEVMASSVYSIPAQTVLRVRTIALYIAAGGLSLLCILIAVFNNLIPGLTVSPSYASPENLVSSSSFGYHSVQVYQLGPEVCVEFNSESAIDIPNSICTDVSSRLIGSDISYQWLALEGTSLIPVKTTEEDAVAVHVVITENNHEIFKHTESFVENMVTIDTTQ